MLADITGLKIERLASTDLSTIGAGFLSGISCGMTNITHQNCLGILLKKLNVNILYYILIIFLFGFIRFENVYWINM